MIRRGAAHPRAKVTTMQVLTMQALWRGPGQFRGRAEDPTRFSTRDLARMSGLSQREIWSIVSAKDRWRCVA